MRGLISHVAAAIVCLGLAGGAAAQTADAPQAGQIGLELNKLEPQDAACRVYLVILNETANDFEDLQIELVSFDPDGLVGQRLAVDLSPVPANKTMVKLFDMPEANCADIDGLLINDVVSCTAGGQPQERCIDLLQPRARGDARFWK